MGTTPDLISPRSARVAAARRLVRRNFRAKDRRFLAEGPQAVREAVALRARSGTDGGVAGDDGPVLLELFATAEAADRHSEILRGARDSGVRVHLADISTLGDIAQTVSPQGLIGVCRFLDRPLEALLAARPRLVAVLAHVRDPGNAGTVLRTADAAGAGAVVFAGDAVDPYNGKCVRASAGSLFHVDVVRSGDPEAVVVAIQAAGIRVLAATGYGDADLDGLADSGELQRPTAWLFGSEAHGLPKHLLHAADARVRVPLYGRAESLNLAAAAAVCLYASARAQRSSGSPDRGANLEESPR